MIVRLSFLLAFLALYGFSFIAQERNFSGAPLQLGHPLPPTLQKIALGYLKQLGGEVQFIKASVFNGGLEGGRDPLEYAEPLAGHLTAAVQLHPRFIDTYFLSQATLPYINADYALRANDILAHGAAALPDNIVPPFFTGFNYFYHLKDPGAAARFLREASQLPGAPAFLGHLASTLAAEGGDIYGGLIWLRTMLAAEDDEHMRQRYQHSITQFERAVLVQQAILVYKQREGRYPEELQTLVPAILPALPELEPPFILSWNPPTLRLLR
jgi:hypothetical protein